MPATEYKNAKRMTVAEILGLGDGLAAGGHDLPDQEPAESQAHDAPLPRLDADGHGLPDQAPAEGLAHEPPLPRLASDVHDLPDQQPTTGEPQDDPLDVKLLDKEIDESIAYFQRDSANRERAERAYDRKIAHLIGEAERTSLFSAEGRRLLSEAVRCREEFEALVGPMITRITEANLPLFRTVLPEEYHEDLITGASIALGALRTTFEATYGAGAVICRLLPSDDEGMTLRIEWFYVSSMFRRRGVFTFLMGELLHRAAQSGVRQVSVSFPADDGDRALLCYIFSSLGFGLSAGVSRERAIRLGHIGDYKMIGSLKQGAAYLSSLTDGERSRMISTALRKSGYQGYLLSRKLPKNYIDPALSCFTGTAADPKALLLAHEKREGTVRVEYIASEKGYEDHESVLCAAFLYKAAMELGDDTIAVIPEGSQRAKRSLDAMCPFQLGRYLINGRQAIPERGGKTV